MQTNWIYKDKIVKTHSDLPAGTIGFTYIIKYDTGEMYVGKKLTESEVRIKPLIGMRKNAKRTKIKSHKFDEYEGSSKLSEGKNILSKEILGFYNDKINLTYAEVELMIKLDVLRDSKYINGNCLGKFFRGKIS